MKKKLLSLCLATALCLPVSAQAQQKLQKLPRDLKVEWEMTSQAPPAQKMVFAQKLAKANYSHEGIEWIERAAADGYAPAQKRLRTIMEKLTVAGDDYYRYRLGYHLLKGTFGEKDIARGRKLIDSAAEAGEPGAQRDLGVFCMDGAYGYTMEASIGRKWLESALEAGDKKAGVIIAGYLYTGTHSYHADKDRAHKMFLDAIHDGDLELIGDIVTGYHTMLNTGNAIEEISQMDQGAARKKAASDPETHDIAMQLYTWAQAYEQGRTMQLANDGVPSKLALATPQSVRDKGRDAEYWLSNADKKAAHKAAMDILRTIPSLDVPAR